MGPAAVPTNGNYYSTATFEPDGSLHTEFAMMEQIHAATSAANSHNEFWCIVDPADDTTSTNLPHDALMECLDIASSSTLGNIVLNNLQMITGGRNGTDTLSRPTLTYGSNTTCNKKIVGDGAVNLLDIAVLLYTQFGSDPYDNVDWSPGVTTDGGPITTNLRDELKLNCGDTITSADYNLRLVANECAGHLADGLLAYNITEGERTRMRRLHTELLQLGGAASGAISSRTNVGGNGGANGVLALPAGVSSHRRHLNSNPNTATLIEFATEAMAISQHRTSLDAKVFAWATIPGKGRWTKIHLPGTVIVAELFLVNHGGDTVGGLDFEKPPPANCDTEECAPVPEEAGRVSLRFSRRLEELDLGRTARDCAIIDSNPSRAIVNGVASVKQMPPAKACPFDLYLWTPDSEAGTPLPAPASGSGEPDDRVYPAAGTSGGAGAGRRLLPGGLMCNGGVGLLAGSSAMDGIKGAIQITLECPVAYIHPSPPSPISPPPSPLQPPALPSLIIDGPAGDPLGLSGTGDWHGGWPWWLWLGVALLLLCCIGAFAFYVRRKNRKGIQKTTRRGWLSTRHRAPYPSLASIRSPASSATAAVLCEGGEADEGGGKGGKGGVGGEGGAVEAEPQGVGSGDGGAGAVWKNEHEGVPSGVHGAGHYCRPARRGRLLVRRN